MTVKLAVHNYQPSLLPREVHEPFSGALLHWLRSVELATIHPSGAFTPWALVHRKSASVYRTPFMEFRKHHFNHNNFRPSQNKYFASGVVGRGEISET